MGCDIHPFVEIKRNGQWEPLPVPEWLRRRSYHLFGILTRGQVRREDVPLIFPEPRGFPADFLNSRDRPDYCHSASWLSLKELVEADYDHETRDFLMPRWFVWLDELQMQTDSLEDVRLVFDFDN